MIDIITARKGGTDMKELNELRKILNLTESECRYAQTIIRFCETINHNGYADIIKQDSVQSIDYLTRAIAQLAIGIDIQRAIEIVHTITCWPSEPGKRNIMLAFLLR